jgi:hypothetical protein
MSIRFWFRRLFSLFGRSAEAVPCNLCRTAIPPSHFKKGLAVMIAQRAYCAGCVEEITVRKTGIWPLAAADAHSSSTVHLP